MLDLAGSVVEPTRGVPLLGVDVFECNGEVDDVQVEVVDAPVAELLAADGLDLLAVVEGLPELADDEEIFALYEAVFDGTGYALAALDFVAVVCDLHVSLCVL